MCASVTLAVANFTLQAIPWAILAIGAICLGFVAFAVNEENKR